MKRLIRLLCAAAAVLAFSPANADPANAIMRLLNSQASGSVRGFTKAAEEVAAEAKKGRPVYAYVLALVSRMPSPPLRGAPGRGDAHEISGGLPRQDQEARE